MSAAGVLLELLEREIAVDLVEGRIRCRHTERALSPGLAARVRQHRDEIVALLSDPDALRLAMAIAIFDAEPIDEEVRLRQIIEAMLGLTICGACGFERNAEIMECPDCHPAPWLPAGCLASVPCTVLGPCQRYDAGALCKAAQPEHLARSGFEERTNHTQVELFPERIAQ